MLKKIIRILHRDGLSGLSQRVSARLRSVSIRRRYRKSRRTSQVDAAKLDQQRSTVFQYQPVFGVIIPLFNTKPEYLQDLLSSFLSQTYQGFKLFLVDASSPENRDNLAQLIEDYHDDRFVYYPLEKNYGISGNTNKGIDMAKKDKEITHICLCDHDDFIEPDALYEYAKTLNENPDIKIIYCDEDVVSKQGDKNAYPVYKSDFDLFHLESSNYINHFFVCEKKLMKPLRAEYDGAQDYDLYLRLAEKTPFYHIGKILYHWRAGDTSTASDPKNKLYAFAAGKRALEDYYQRNRIDIKKVAHTAIFGTYKTEYSSSQSPTITIIDSSKPLAEINQAAREAKGEFLLFLDPGIKPANDDYLTEMPSILSRKGADVVTGLVVDKKGAIQNAGIIFEKDKPVFVFRGENSNYTYANRAGCVMAYPATAASCFMMEKSTFDKLGGLSGSRYHDGILELPSVYTPHARFRMV